jgi:hypothetical protein
VVTCILHAAARMNAECLVHADFAPRHLSRVREASTARNETSRNLSRVLKARRDAVTQAETVGLYSHALDEAAFATQDSLCFAMHYRQMKSVLQQGASVGYRRRAVWHG